MLRSYRTRRRGSLIEAQRPNGTAKASPDFICSRLAKGMRHDTVDLMTGSILVLSCRHPILWVETVRGRNLNGGFNRFLWPARRPSSAATGCPWPDDVWRWMAAI